MKHLAVQSMSVRARRPYTTPGLGDRIHTCLLGYQYGAGEPVTLHLTQSKMNRDKPRSWAEILSLFPDGALRIQSHPVDRLSSLEWVRYLKDAGHDAEAYYYGDMATPQEGETFDAAELLRESPRLTPPDAALVRDHVTVNWVGGGQAHDSRKMGDTRRIEERYEESGHLVVPVGGDAPRLSLRDMASLMATAHAHAGIDSGPMHLASLYLPHERLHVYSTLTHPSHHVRRWVANGAKRNPFA